MRVGDNDKLFGSVTSHIVGDALAAQGLDVDRRHILFEHSIRTLGEHPVRIRLHADIEAHITVKVVSEEHHGVQEEETPVEPAKPEEALPQGMPTIAG